MKNNRPAWLRWVLLAAVIALCVMIGMDMAEYADIGELGVFSPERWAEVIAACRFQWALRGSMAVWGLYVFVTWDLDREEKCPMLADGCFSTVFTLLFAVSPRVIAPALSDAMWVIWGILLAALVAVTAHHWYKYWKRNRKNKD